MILNVCGINFFLFWKNEQNPQKMYGSEKYMFYSIRNCSNTLLHLFLPFQTSLPLLHLSLLQFDILFLSHLFFCGNFFFAFLLRCRDKNNASKKKKKNALFLLQNLFRRFFLLPFSFNFFFY